MTAPVVRRRVVPIVAATAAPAAPVASTGPKPRKATAGDRTELKKKLAEIIQAPSEPTEGTAAYIIKKYRDRVRNPMTAIRAKCMECSNGYLKEVEHCQVKLCALHPFRLGKNPFHSRSKAYLELHGNSADVSDAVDSDDDADDTDEVQDEPVEAKDE